MGFTSDPASLVLSSDMQMLAYKIVNGQLVEHPFAPEINMETGRILVKTLGFSAYVVAAAPILVAVPTTPLPDTTTSLFVLLQTPRPLKVPTIEEEVVRDSGFKLLFIIIIVCGGVACILCLALGCYLRRSGHSTGKRSKTASNTVGPVPVQFFSSSNSLWGSSRADLDPTALTNVTGKRISQALDSSRVQESHPASDYMSTFQVRSDMVHADGRANAPRPVAGDSSHASSELEARLFDADMEEEEPHLRPITHSYTPEMLAGSVGRFGTGMKPKLPSFRPAVSETATSLVWNAPGPSGKVEPISLTADLIVLSPLEASDVVLEEDDPESLEMAPSLESNGLQVVSIRDVLYGKSATTSVREKIKTFEGTHQSNPDIVQCVAATKAMRTGGNFAPSVEDQGQGDGEDEHVAGINDVFENEVADPLTDSCQKFPGNKEITTQTDHNDQETEKILTKKRNFFNSSMFSFSKKKAIEQEEKYLTPPCSEKSVQSHSDATTKEGSISPHNEHETAVAMAASVEVLSDSELALPSLTSGMDVEDEFEEAEPGNFHGRYLCKIECSRVYVSTHWCALLSCGLHCFCFQRRIDTSIDDRLVNTCVHIHIQMCTHKYQTNAIESSRNGDSAALGRSHQRRQCCDG